MKKQLRSDILSVCNVIGIHPQDQDMNQRITAGSSRQHVEGEPITDPNTSAVPITFADFQKDFNHAYHQFCISWAIDTGLKRRVSEFDITIPEFEKLTLKKQYQRYITLEEGKIRFDEMPVCPHGEIASLLLVMISRQVEGANFVDGLEGSLDNGILFVNSSNGHRCQIE